MAKKKSAAATPAPEVIESFKGFDSNLRCRYFQYEIGKTYRHDGEIKACGSGFHACEYPLDVFRYYPPADSRFARTTQTGQTDREQDSDSKVASSEITIKAEISIADLIKAAIEYTFKRAKPVDPASPASATGVRGAASATGDSGAASATGDSGAASATGDSGAASATGYRGAASATGVRGAASATGVRGAASATGDSGAASATGDHSVAIATGFYGRAMAGPSGAIVLVNRDDNGAIRHIRASNVGENGIEPNVWYTLNDAGEFEAVK